MNEQGAPRPGWYPDPAGAWQYRYWDGTGWTGHTAPMGGGLAGGGAGGPKVVPPLPFPAVRADFGRRALGYVIDVLVIVIPMVIVVFAAVFAVVAAASSDSSGPGAGIFLVIVPLELAVFFLPFLYNGFFTGGGRRTVGERIAGLRVVDARTGAPLTLGKSFLRALVAALASGQLWGLGYWWSLWDGEQRTWHDMASGSVVIDVRSGDPVAS